MTTSKLNYTVHTKAMGNTADVTVGNGVDHLWITMGGLRIQVSRDGWDAEPLICIDAWKAGDELQSDPVSTMTIEAPKSIDE